MRIRARAHAANAQPIRLLFASLALAVVAGCSSPRMEPLPAARADSFPISTNCAGLVVAADPYFDKARIKKHFGQNIVSRGVVPIRIIFSNTRSEGSYLLQPESISLLSMDGIIPQPVADAKSAHPKTNTLPWYVGGPLAAVLVTSVGLATAPVLLAAEERQEDSRDVARQMEAIRFLDRPLYPSDSNSGFLYFRLSNVKDLHRISAMRFQIRDLRSKEDITVVLNLRRP